MTAEAAIWGQLAAAGAGRTRASAPMAMTPAPLVTSTVSKNFSRPDFTSVFQAACSSAARSTRSMTPVVIGEPLIAWAFPKASGSKADDGRHARDDQG